MSSDLDVYQPAQIDQYQARMVMTPEQAKALDAQVRACTSAVLRPGTDYGIIPGTGDDRKTLLKPGAEKLLQWFGFAYTMNRTEIDVDDDGVKQGVTYRCTIIRRLPDGTTAEVATCEGYAGYDELKFYAPVTDAARHKAEARERGWARKDGRVADPTKWKNLQPYRAPWNTIIKMAQKRALVGATVDATAAAGLFSTEEDSSPAADDGSTWLEQALERAVDVTDPEEGNALYVEAAEAHKKGWCNRKQQDLIQNILKKRARLLKNVTVTEVEDLASRAAAESAQDAAEDTQDAGPGRADDEGREPPEDALPVEDPPDWPEVVKPGTGTP